MKGVQDMIAQMKQMKTPTNSIGKPRIIDHNKIIAAPREDNIDDDMLVVEKPQITPKPNVDKRCTCLSKCCFNMHARK